MESGLEAYATPAVSHVTVSTVFIHAAREDGAGQKLLKPQLEYSRFFSADWPIRQAYLTNLEKSFDAFALAGTGNYSFKTLNVFDTPLTVATKI